MLVRKANQVVSMQHRHATREMKMKRKPLRAASLVPLAGLLMLGLGDASSAEELGSGTESRISIAKVNDNERDNYRHLRAASPAPHTPLGGLRTIHPGDVASDVTTSITGNANGRQTRTGYADIELTIGTTSPEGDNRLVISEPRDSRVEPVSVPAHSRVTRDHGKVVVHFPSTPEGSGVHQLLFVVNGAMLGHHEVHAALSTRPSQAGPWRVGPSTHVSFDVKGSLPAIRYAGVAHEPDRLHRPWPGLAL